MKLFRSVIMKILIVFGSLLLEFRALNANEKPINFSVLYGKKPDLMILADENFFLNISIAGWGPNWSWMGWKSEAQHIDGKLKLNCKSKDLKAELIFSEINGRILLEAKMTAGKNMEITSIILGIDFPGIEDGNWKTTSKEGEILEGKMPFYRGKLTERKEYKSVEITNKIGKTIFYFEPAIALTADNGQLRVHFATGKVEEKKDYSFKVNIELPGRCTLYSDYLNKKDEENNQDWYQFNGTGHPQGESVLDMSDWSLDITGSKGRIEMKNDKLFYNGKPIKLWGINLCYSNCAPKKELAEKRALLYKRYGINAIRLHKYADGSGWQGILSKDDASKFDPEELDRMDYFIAKLKEAGIFVKLSPIFYVKPRPANRKEIPYYDEFKKDHDVAQTGGGAMYLGSELQNLQIRQMQNLLKHKNPYTGMTYAEDPVIAIIELCNEDSILFYNTLSVIQNIPSLRKRSAEMFTEWLKNKYKTKENLLSAWGNDMLGNFKAEGFSIESWEENQIYPVGNPWFYSPAQLDGSQKKRKARLLDTIEFLTELQDSVYKRMSDAIRETGYKGILLSSNWQAGSGTSHYMNLYSDSKVGLIDRHNYFGDWNENIIFNSSMLSIPGSGILSTGFQQVSDRPFMMSEWIHVIPNEWGVEGPAIIGSYGMGLQGWDVSFMFQNTDPGEFLKAIPSSKFSCWHIAIPQILGSFPAVSRMVRRQDVKEAEKTHELNVHLPAMLEGKWDFEDKTTQQYDVKSFTTDIVPTEALAVCRIAVNFVDKPKENKPFIFDKFKTSDGAYISDTGELFWKPGKKATDGFFSIKTNGTEALVGFAEQQTVSGNFADITSLSPFASIFITAKNKDKTLFNDNNILISCIARARNFGAIYLFDKIIANFGDDKNGPIILESVKAEIKLKRQGNPTVYILDHDGVNTRKTIPLENGILKIDGNRDKTPYYLIEYK